jgi:hypothetical protein
MKKKKGKFVGTTSEKREVRYSEKCNPKREVKISTLPTLLLVIKILILYNVSRTYNCCVSTRLIGEVQ